METIKNISRIPGDPLPNLPDRLEPDTPPGINPDPIEPIRIQPGKTEPGPIHQPSYQIKTNNIKGFVIL